jgi:hypothetical protein
MIGKLGAESKGQILGYYFVNRTIELVTIFITVTL